MPVFNYPTNYELSQIEPDLTARAAAGRVGLDIMPVRNVNAGEVRWSQQDNFYGLQALRGLDGAPTRVQRVGTKTYTSRKPNSRAAPGTHRTERRSTLPIWSSMRTNSSSTANLTGSKRPSGRCSPPARFRSRWTARLVRRSVSLTRSPFRRSRPA
jgi:hypothetical protein